MAQDVVAIMTELLERIPEWIRIELSSKDMAGRMRAEETLAAMIAAALCQSEIDRAA